MEWSAICRVCLQEGQLYRLFTEDGADTAMSLKFKQCSSILELDHGCNMPEHICDDCVKDLEVAYQFRLNCERSDTILRSFVTVPSSDANSAQQANSIDGTQSPTGQPLYRVPNDVLSSNNTIDDKTATFEYLSIAEYERILQNQEEDQHNKVDLLISVEPSDQVQQVYIKNELTQPEIDDEHIIPEEYACSEIDEQPSSVDDALDNENLVDDASDVVMQIKPVITNKARWVNRDRLAGTNTDPLLADNVIHSGTVKTLRVKHIFNDEKPMKVCDICGNKYKYQHALESHLRRHRNDKPFKCNICGKGFVINFELSRHMRTHTGHKPYACKFCDRKFSDFGSRIKHERTHTGERPYYCEICGKSFAYSHVLSSHMLTHTGIKKYECNVCLKRFTKSHHLKAHMNTHERVRIVPLHLISSTTNATDDDDRMYADLIGHENEMQNDGIVDDLDANNVGILLEDADDEEDNKTTGDFSFICHR